MQLSVYLQFLIFMDTNTLIHTRFLHIRFPPYHLNEMIELGKGIFFYETRQKIFSLLGGKIKFELALQPSTASTAKIQIQFSRQGD